MPDIVAKIADEFPGAAAGNAPGDFGEGKSHLGKAEYAEIIGKRRDVMVDAPPSRTPAGIDPFSYTALELAIQTHTAPGKLADGETIVKTAAQYEAFLRSTKAKPIADAA
jgi:hypothetical protein